MVGVDDETLEGEHVDDEGKFDTTVSLSLQKEELRSPEIASLAVEIVVKLLSGSISNR